MWVRRVIAYFLWSMFVPKLRMVAALLCFTPNLVCLPFSSKGFSNSLAFVRSTANWNSSILIKRQRQGLMQPSLPICLESPLDFFFVKKTCPLSWGRSSRIDWILLASWSALFSRGHFKFILFPRKRYETWWSLKATYALIYDNSYLINKYTDCSHTHIAACKTPSSLSGIRSVALLETLSVHDTLSISFERIIFQRDPDRNDRFSWSLTIKGFPHSIFGRFSTITMKRKGELRALSFCSYKFITITLESRFAGRSSFSPCRPISVFK